MKFAICNETFQNQSWKEACEITSKCGYEGIELAPFTLGNYVTDISDAERHEIKHIAEDNGLEIIGLHWLLVLHKGADKKLHINCADDAIRNGTVEYYKELIHFCGELGGKVMVHGSPGARNWDPADFYQDTFKRTVDFYSSCMDTAKECGVTICFEPLSYAETNFIHTAADTQVLIDAVNHPNFQLHLDTKAMCGAEYKAPADVIRQYKHVMKHFHANDRNKKGPGTGDVDFMPIAEALKETGYDGYVSVEVFDYTPDGETIARESIQYLQMVF